MQFSKSWLNQLVPFAMILIAGSAAMPLFAQMSVENPWAESSKPLIDEKPMAVESNSWRARDSAETGDGYDESKYPPLDENAALGTEYSGSPSEYSATGGAWPGGRRAGDNYYPQIQNYEQTPVYPDNSRREFPSYNRRYPAYQRNYQPEYPSRYGYGSNSRGGLPFFGNSGSGFPFSMGNSMMPFSGQGFW